MKRSASWRIVWQMRREIEIAKILSTQVDIPIGLEPVIKVPLPRGERLGEGSNRLVIWTLP